LWVTLSLSVHIEDSKDLLPNTLLMHICKEFDRIRKVGIDSDCCGCVIIRNHSLPCACELVRYDICSTILNVVHVIWTILNFSTCHHAIHPLSILFKKKLVLFLNCFKEVNIAGKMIIKTSYMSYPDMTSMCSPVDKVKTKGS